MTSLTCPHCGAKIDVAELNLMLKCKRCGHEWTRRNFDSLPTVCPKCKSPYWNRVKRKHDTSKH